MSTRENRFRPDRVKLREGETKSQFIANALNHGYTAVYSGKLRKFYLTKIARKK